MSFPLPHVSVPVMDLDTGLMTEPWFLYFSQKEDRDQLSDTSDVNIVAIRQAGSLIESLRLSALLRSMTLPRQQEAAPGLPPVRPRKWGTFEVLTPDTHANRLANYPSPLSTDQGFIETDRTVFYVSEVMSGSLVWVYIDGVYLDTFANQPADLGTNDTGFRFTASDTAQHFRWTGAAFVEEYEITNAVTAAVTSLLNLIHKSSGTPAANFGAALAYQLHSSTNVLRNAGYLDTIWTTATNAAETAAMVVRLMNTGATAAEIMRIRGDGNVGIGETIPADLLHIKGANKNLLIENTSSLEFGLKIQNAGTVRGSYTVNPNTGEVKIGAISGGGYFLTFYSNNVESMRVDTGNRLGVGLTTITAVVHIKAGTASASSAPLKFTSGTNLTSAEAGAVEWDGTLLYITQTSGPTRKTIAYTTDIPSFPAVKDTIALTNQGADIGTTNFANSSTAGTYQIDYYLVDPSTDITAGTVQITFAFTDAGGATTVVSAALALTAVGRTSGVFMVQLSSGSISYAVAHTGIFGNAKYNLYATLTRLS